MGDKFVIYPTGEYKEVAQIIYQKIGGLTSGDIRNLLLNNGPMVVDIWGDHSNNKLNHISTLNDNLSIIHQPSFGIFQNGEKVKVDHDVLLVGYGITLDKKTLEKKKILDFTKLMGVRMGSQGIFWNFR